VQRDLTKRNSWNVQWKDYKKVKVIGTLKGAVCALKVLYFHWTKDKDTIICLQRFRTHAKVKKTKKKQCYNQLFYFEMCIPCHNMFLSVWSCPMPIYPILFSHPRLQFGGQCITTTEARKQIRSERTDYPWPKKPWHPPKMLYDKRHIKTWINQLINLL